MSCLGDVSRGIWVEDSNIEEGALSWPPKTTGGEVKFRAIFDVGRLLVAMEQTFLSLRQLDELGFPPHIVALCHLKSISQNITSLIVSADNKPSIGTLL